MHFSFSIANYITFLEGFVQYFTFVFSTVTDVKLCYEGRFVFSVSQGNFLTLSLLVSAFFLC